MSIIEQLKSDRTSAIKSNDSELKSVLGIILGEIDRQRGTKVLDDSVAISSIKKLIAATNENITLAKKSGIPAEKYESDLVILKKYVPDVQLLSEEETRKLVADLIASGANNIGLVMKGTAGKAVDKALVSKIAKEMLDIGK